MQHSWHRGPQAALLRLGWLFFALAFGCGGRSQNPFTDDARDASLCSPPPCATNESWDAASCACESTVGIWPGGPDPDATTACPPGGCPAGSVEAMAGAACTCLLVEAGADEEPLADGTRADAHQDEGQDSPEPSPYDATVDDSAYSSDSPPSYDAYFDSNFCGPMACGPGSAATPDCQCVPCAGSCPAGETQSAGCGTCTACAYKCPASFVYAGSEHGNTCDCEPPGADAGPPFGADAGATCVLEGTTTAALGRGARWASAPTTSRSTGASVTRTARQPAISRALLRHRARFPGWAPARTARSALSATALVRRRRRSSVPAIGEGTRPAPLLPAAMEDWASTPTLRRQARLASWRTNPRAARGPGAR